MTDVMTLEQRRRNMSRIKGKDTGPELRLRRALWRTGLRYRLNYKLPGRPDLVFVSARLAVFVDGCFWHGCPLHGAKPKANATFWREKLLKNVARDEKVNTELQEMGWQVIRFWEHEIDADVYHLVDSIRALVRPNIQ